jgi:SAM-dependent methyltransferase
MHSSHLFYQYYDVLFAAKDYAGEVEAVLRYCDTYPLQPLATILEIGCGTGNHTVELANRPHVQVTAVDVDPEMLALAQAKAALAQRGNITFAAGIDGVSNVDLCVALFNVVNYICGEESLRRFFTGIAASLRSQGMFVFDCWNGTAALLDPPGAKTYEQQCGREKVRCHLTSQTDVFRGITTLNYQLDLFDESDKKIESGNYQIEHRLWTPVQIKAALREAGLEVVTVCIPFKFEQEATDSDWKIMFACRKV